MGCWNGTCMISNLPIISGEDVKLVLLYRPYETLKELKSSAYCYPNGIFHVGAFALDAKYNDYGNVEDIVEDLNFKLVEKYFKEKYKKIRVEKKELSEFNLYDILGGIERGSLHVFSEGDVYRKEMAQKAMKAYKDMPDALEHWKEMANMDISPQWRIPTYNMVMIRADVWNNICKEHKTEYYKDDEDRKTKDDYYQTAQEWVDKRFRKYEEAQADSLASMFLIYDNPLNMGGYAGGNFMFMYDLYYPALKNNIKFFKKAFTEFMLIDSFLGATRKGWMVVSGAGSQSAAWESYQLLNKIVEEVCVKQRAEYEGEE